MTENKNILEVHHLKKSFTTGKKSFTAVEDISFSLKTGEVLGIVGESGSLAGDSAPVRKEKPATSTSSKKTKKSKQKTRNHRRNK